MGLRPLTQDERLVLTWIAIAPPVFYSIEAIRDGVQILGDLSAERIGQACSSLALVALLDHRCQEYRANQRLVPYLIDPRIIRGMAACLPRDPVEEICTLNRSFAGLCLGPQELLRRMAHYAGAAPLRLRVVS